jgi:hypothetical protein
MFGKIILLASLIAFPLVAHAATVQLPRTGQTTCYDSVGNLISCVGTGQDGATQAGVSWPTPRFTDNNNGRVTDNLTGLIWLKDAWCLPPQTFTAAITTIKALHSGQCGLTDNSVAGNWGLPNVHELESLLDLGQVNPTLPSGNPFRAGGYYWASTTDSGYPYESFVVDIEGGLVTGAAKNNPFLIWPVFRAATGPQAAVQLPKTGQTDCWDDNGNIIACAGTGQDGDSLTGASWPSPRFQDNANGTVTDNLTGLTWLQNGTCFGDVTWDQALTAANTLASGACGLTDGSTAGMWRLANRSELVGLVNFEVTDSVMWLNSHGFNYLIPEDWFWTSDSVMGSSIGDKWVFHMNLGGQRTQTLAQMEWAGPRLTAASVLAIRSPAASRVSVAPASQNFSSVAVGQSSTAQSFSISNSGSSSLPVTLSLAGGDSAMFSINPGNGTAGTCGSLSPTLGAGGNCNVAIAFAPTSAGTKTTTFSVVPTTPGVPGAAATLTGSGTTASFSVTASITGGNGSITSTNPASVAAGASAAFTVNPAAGYQPGAVSGSCPAGSFSGNTYSSGAVSAACTVIFSFTPISYTISTATTGSGTITCSPATTVPYGTTVSCTVAPAAGNNISTVTIDSVTQTISNPSSFTNTFAAVSANHSMSASFSAAGGTSGFTQKDIGGVSLAGNLTSSNGVYSLSGSGSDIWLTADSFSFGYQTLVGDGQITARVASLQNTDPWAKSGVMIRETLSANSAHALMVVTAGNGSNFQRRLSTGASSLNTGPSTATAPYWVKLVRSGVTFTGYVSPDGVTWTLVGSDTISMASTVYVGLAVTSHNNAALCAATFDGVTVNSGTSAPPAVQITAPASGATFTAPANITITAAATASTGGTVSRVDFYQGAISIGSSTASPYSVSWNNVVAGTYTLTAKVTDTKNATATSSPVSITVTSAGGGLPSPWVNSDIGSVGAKGSASYLNGVYSMSGAGSDIWGSADAFNFLYRPLTGDGQIIARLASEQNTNAWAKAGLMIRETLTAAASYAMMAVTPTNGTTFQRRLSSGSFYLASTGPTMAAPCWLKLVRSGNTFTGYVSTDGVTWVLAGSDTIVMQSTVYIGLALTSHNSAVLGTATFDGVQ